MIIVENGVPKLHYHINIEEERIMSMKTEDGKKQIVKVIPTNKLMPSYYLKSKEEWINFRRGFELAMPIAGIQLAFRKNAILNYYTGEVYANLEYYVQQ